MIMQISDKEIMTVQEAKDKYEKYYIGFVETKRKSYDPDNTEGYVVYTMESKEDEENRPRKTEDGSYIALLSGYNIGGCEISTVFSGG